MAEHVLQFQAPEFTQFEEYVLLSGNALMLVLGLAIVYLAFRGYRRNRSRPMLYIAIGFLLVLFVPFLIQAVPYLALPGLEKPVIFLSMAIQLAGLAVILYALWI